MVGAAMVVYRHGSETDNDVMRRKKVFAVPGRQLVSGKNKISARTPELQIGTRLVKEKGSRVAGCF